MESVDDLNRAAGAFNALVVGTHLDQLTDATPCSEWDVRALLNHVITGTQWFTTLLRSEPATDRTIDQVGEDPGAAFGGAFRAFDSALAAPGALEVTYEHRMGPVSGTRLAEMRTNEYMVHGWDLAIATGQPVLLPEDLALKCIALYEDLLAGRPREPGGAFGAVVTVADDASPVDRLVAFFGRDPR